MWKNSTFFASDNNIIYQNLNIKDVNKAIFNVVALNCNYILFTKLPWPGDSEGTFRSSRQTAICPRVYHTHWRFRYIFFIAKHETGKQ